MPTWVTQRPVSQQYYTGVGQSSKSQHPTQFHNVAQKEALKQIASDIWVLVSSEETITKQEDNADLQEQYTSHIKASTWAFLQGYEKVDAWEDASVYCIYYRLSKKTYQQGLARQQEQIISNASLLQSQADNLVKQGAIAEGAAFYLRAFSSLEQGMGPFFAGTRSREVFDALLGVQKSLQQLFSEIAFASKASDITARGGLPLPAPLSASVSFNIPGKALIPLKRLPVKAYFTLGQGVLKEKALSDDQGAVYIPVSQIHSGFKHATVTLTPDLSALLPYDSTQTSSSWLARNLILPSQVFQIKVNAVNFFIESTELNLGAQLQSPVLLPSAARFLQDKGYDIADKAETADYKITIKLDTRKVSEMHGLFFSVADITITIRNMSQAKDIYTLSVPDIKGGHLDYTQAGLKACQAAKKKLTESLLPDFLKSL